MQFNRIACEYICIVKQIEHMESKKVNEKNIAILMKNLGLAPKNFNCDRCFGSGYIPKFNHVEGGISFKCRGEKYYTSYKAA